MLVYSSHEFNSEVLPVFLCSGKGLEAFVWDRVPGFLMQVSCWLRKTLYKPDSQNPPSPCQGRRIKDAALTWEEEGKVEFRKNSVLLKNKSIMRFSENKWQKGFFQFLYEIWGLDTLDGRKCRKSVICLLLQEKSTQLICVKMKIRIPIMWQVTQPWCLLLKHKC